MVAVVALVAAVLLAAPLPTVPPAAHLSTGGVSSPLAVSSWCFGKRCGAPLAASTRTLVVARGTVVRCILAFAPTSASLTVGGHVVKTALTAHTVSWRATSTGGIALRVMGAGGWVVYVGGIALRK